VNDDPSSSPALSTTICYEDVRPISLNASPKIRTMTLSESALTDPGGKLMVVLTSAQNFSAIQ